MTKDWRRLAQAHLDQLTKPVGSLGRLEDIAVQLAYIQESEPLQINRKAVFVFAADHGVAVEGVSAYPAVVTEQMVRNFLRGGAAINVLARAASAELHIVDLGVNADFDDPRLRSRKVRTGSRNFRIEPAMTDEELEAAWQVGVECAEIAKADGVDMVAVGEIGIGNTTAASAIAAALTGLPAEEVTGPGTGVTGAALLNKQRVVADAIALHFPSLREQRPDPRAILRCVGGLEISAMVGFTISCARLRLATVIDGFISTAAGALACQMVPSVRDFLFVGHKSHEPGHQALLAAIGKAPLLDLDMRLGEGTGAVLAFHLIESAMRLYNDMATFQTAGVSGAVSP